jgi:hypothetical protein
MRDVREKQWKKKPVGVIGRLPAPFFTDHWLLIDSRVYISIYLYLYIYLGMATATTHMGVLRRLATAAGAAAAGGGGGEGGGGGKL